MTLRCKYRENGELADIIAPNPAATCLDAKNPLPMPTGL